MLSRQIRRASAIFALTAACLILPLSDAGAAPRSESRWNGVEQSVRVLRVSFRNVLKSLWAQLSSSRGDAGMDIDGNG